MVEGRKVGRRTNHVRPENGKRHVYLTCICGTQWAGKRGIRSCMKDHGPNLPNDSDERTSNKTSGVK